jgi:hypothetical protein
MGYWDEKRDDFGNVITNEVTVMTSPQVYERWKKGTMWNGYNDKPCGDKCRENCKRNCGGKK